MKTFSIKILTIPYAFLVLQLRVCKTSFILRYFLPKTSYMFEVSL